MDRKETDIALVFKALSDVNRLKIIKILEGGEQCACRLLDKFNITQPTLSHHMKILCDCKLVNSRREGKWMHYSLDQERLGEVSSYISGTKGEESKWIYRDYNKERKQMDVLDLIQSTKIKALRGEKIDRETIIRLLSINPETSVCEELGKAAYEVAQVVTKGAAYLWGALGVDYKPCEMNCDFCSLGEAWGLVKASREFSDEEIIEEVAAYVSDGTRWIVLRTTEFYSLDILGELIKKIRKEVVGEYEIGLNVGEFDDEKALKLHEIGVDFIYHSLRMGEGKDTRFDPKDRLNTLRAIKNSPLKLVYLVEPIGVEHSNEEIADICLSAIEHNAIVSGAMARIPVEGTPLGKYPQISEKRLAQIIAITRLAGGYHVPDICVHPASELAIKYGANVAVIETGSVPRQGCDCFKNKWNEFDAVVAKAWFERNGYELCQKAR